ncbi:MAG TPA: 3'(2'),5'-bisphosphate nucleotidase CysQ [Thermodesulfovibrionia bacterium]|nr:3'(2'),5'-bisphosphate nucleotidase CysQ [Thermodesulfovibrionia bacterium]
MDKIDMQALLDRVVDIAQTAGKAIMEIYNKTEPETVFYKEDKSPLTLADMASHTIISEELQKLSLSIPVLSEEAANIPYEVRKSWERFWLVDPLDGTKEFIKRNNEFTVNIALIDRTRPVLGVVHAPALDVTYSATTDTGAFKLTEAGRQQITVSGQYNGQLKIVASRSHGNAAVEQFINKFPDALFMAKGSSLKFCLVAEGSAHLYPRFGPTMEWDTAAAQCVVECAGGTVTDIQGIALKYNKPDLHNPFFVVSGLKDFPWQS